MSRFNVYAEELTGETELVTKVATVGGEERTFYGVRLFLASPDVLHHTADDDDRSAITFFVPWTKANGYDFELVQATLDGLRGRLEEATRASMRQKITDHDRQAALAHEQKAAK